MNSDGTNPGNINVKVSAIDGDFLVLEVVPGGETFRWPISNLPKPLQIGSSLVLELKSSGITVTANEPAHAKDAAKTKPASDEKRDESRRRLLEQLVN